MQSRASQGDVHTELSVVAVLHLVTFVGYAVLRSELKAHELGWVAFMVMYPFLLVIVARLTGESRARMQQIAAWLAIVGTVGLVCVTGALASPALVLFIAIPSVYSPTCRGRVLDTSLVLLVVVALAVADACGWTPPFRVQTPGRLATLFVLYVITLVALATSLRAEDDEARQAEVIDDLAIAREVDDERVRAA